MKKILISLLVFVLIMGGFTACKNAADPVPSTEETVDAEEPAQDEPEENEEESEDSADTVEVTQKIILATTTSTEDSGLLDVILPLFTAQTGVDVEVVSVGTGAALKMGEDGDADAVLVHNTAAEEEFVANGHSDQRRDVMYNDFVLVGPKEDKDGIAAAHDDNIGEALKAIAEGELIFVSRGDDSGTHAKELTIWKESDIEPAGDWYQSVGKGMGDTLQMASEQQGYTLTDRATYLKMEKELDLEIITQGDDKMFNQYGVMVVNPEKNDNINNEGAILFAEWIVSDVGQAAIAGYVEENSGQPLFTANAA